MKTETKKDILSSLFSGSIVALTVIFCYLMVFYFGKWLLGTEHYVEIIILMVFFALSTGACYPLLAKGSAKSPAAMIAFFATLTAANRFINIFEIHIFVMITIITATLVKILIWTEIKRMAPASSNNPSEK